MSSGTVMFFDAAQGYGFIHPAAGGRDVCVLSSAVDKAKLATLRPGEPIEYDLACNLAGTLIAVNLKLRSAGRVSDRAA